MPELPEVEMVVRGLRPDMVGRSFTGADVRWSRELVDHSPESFASRLAGQRVIAMRRRAKYIIFELTDDYLLVHLKMTGRLYVSQPNDRAAADNYLRVVMFLDDGRELRFSDMRKFGRVYLVAALDSVTGNLGPEPLEDDFTLEALKEQLASRSGTIKPLLLDQTFVAGVGNIYADESLWHARIDPRRKADTLRGDEVARLHNAIRQVLQAGIDAEGSTFNWYRKPDGTSGEYQNQFRVYDREGQPCFRCDTPIEKIRLAQRGTHFCPNCQTKG